MVYVLLSCWMCSVLLFVFFFKQKTAYEMRISDWSSDVCSSDLDSRPARSQGDRRRGVQLGRRAGAAGRDPVSGTRAAARADGDNAERRRARDRLGGPARRRYAGERAEAADRDPAWPRLSVDGDGGVRSEERRVGQAGASRGRSRGKPLPSIKIN